MHNVIRIMSPTEYSHFHVAYLLVFDQTPKPDRVFWTKYNNLTATSLSLE